MGNIAEFELIKMLLDKNATVATAESCTGGMVAARLTSVSGASGAFKSGAVTYCNEATNVLQAPWGIPWRQREWKTNSYPLHYGNLSLPNGARFPKYANNPQVRTDTRYGKD